MQRAVFLAEKAALKDEVPVGAVIVKDGKIIAEGYNLKEKKNCSVYHAEIVAIIKACKKTGDWRLNGCEMYVTLEPCPMCAGAIVNSRIDKLFFGAYDKKAGGCKTLYSITEDSRLNHRLEVKGGIMEKECAEILSKYFENKRKKNQNELSQNKYSN